MRLPARRRLNDDNVSHRERSPVAPPLADALGIVRAGAASVAGGAYLGAGRDGPAGIKG